MHDILRLRPQRQLWTAPRRDGGLHLAQVVTAGEAQVDHQSISFYISDR